MIVRAVFTPVFGCSRLGGCGLLLLLFLLFHPPASHFLLRAQGFDLEPYAGKEVTKYTYTVLNYPDYPENVVVDLLFDDHRMIGADITYNDAENGFTRALINDTMQSGLTVTLTQ